MSTRRSVSIRAFAGLVTGSMIVACSTFGDGAELDASAPVDAASDGVASGDAATTEDSGEGGGDGGLLRFCLRSAQNAYRHCDDFQEGPLYEPPWSSTPTLENLDLAALSRAASGLDAFFRVDVPVSSMTTAGFLRHDFDAVTKPTIKVAFTCQINGFASGNWIEIASVWASGGPSVGVAFFSDELHLFASGGADVTIPLAARQRSRVRLEISEEGVDVVDATGKSIARISAPADAGADAGMVGALHLGIGLYYASKVAAAGSIEIDDVVIDY